LIICWLDDGLFTGNLQFCLRASFCMHVHMPRLETLCKLGAKAPSTVQHASSSRGCGFLAPWSAWSLCVHVGSCARCRIQSCSACCQHCMLCSAATWPCLCPRLHAVTNAAAFGALCMVR
jgi:hypothetical protein